MTAAGPGPALAAAPRQGTLERVPLPWFLKQRVMNAFLRDVHHYLFDVEYGPPGRPAVHIQQTIRQRFLEAVCAPAVTRPHVVVSHSMGTVIAYDCLKRLDRLRDHRRAHHHRQSARPRRDSGQAEAGVEPCGRVPVPQSDWRLDESLRSARSGLRVRPAACERLRQARRHRRGGYPRAERGRLAAFRHQVHAATGIRGCARADARRLTPCSRRSISTSLRGRAQDALKKLAGVQRGGTRRGEGARRGTAQRPRVRTHGPARGSGEPS